MAQIEVEAADYRAFLRGELDGQQLFARMTITNHVTPQEELGQNSSFGR